MSYKCCKFIRNGINFTRTGVRFCNKLSASGENSIVEYTKDFYKQFVDFKKNVISDCIKGKLPKYCEGCFYLEDKNWNEDDFKINEVELFHWNQCNCACVYCGNRNETHLKITEKKCKSEFVDLYKTLKQFIKEKKFAEKVNVSFVGGEPTLLKEFCNILKLFMKQKYKMHILTNGILFEKLFAKFIKSDIENYMTISLDCGSREMFKKIKGVDKFDNVVEEDKIRTLLAARAEKFGLLKATNLTTVPTDNGTYFVASSTTKSGNKTTTTAATAVAIRVR